MYLTLSEAKAMKADLEGLVSKPALNHSHISTDDLNKEITVAIYDDTKIDEHGFNERKI